MNGSAIANASALTGLNGIADASALSGLAGLLQTPGVGAALATLALGLLKAPRAVSEPEPAPRAESEREARAIEPEPIHVPEPLPIVPEAEPVRVPPPEPLCVSPELDVKEAGPRPPMEYSSVKRSREEVWPMVVAPERTSSEAENIVAVPRKRFRGADGNFESYQRPCASADEIAQAFAPKGQFHLEPNIKMTPEDCEARIDDLENRFGVKLSKQAIKKEREKRSAAPPMIAEYQACLRNAEQLEKLFVFVETLRKLASK